MSSAVKRSKSAKSLAFCFTFMLVAALGPVAAGTAAHAANSPADAISRVRIKNFGRMDARFYRGAQPEPNEYKQLKDLGIATIIDLRNDPTAYERSAAEAAGMRYVNIPMSDKEKPSKQQIEEFLKLANDPATGAFYVHCLGGRHRTGVMGAIYRMTHDGWNYDRAYEEMKHYDFYTRWGHGALKEYVKDYYQQHLHQAAAVKVPSGGASSTTEN